MARNTFVTTFVVKKERVRIFRVFAKTGDFYKYVSRLGVVTSKSKRIKSDALYEAMLAAANSGTTIHI